MEKLKEKFALNMIIFGHRWIRWKQVVMKLTILYCNYKGKECKLKSLLECKTTNWYLKIVRIRNKIRNLEAKLI